MALPVLHHAWKSSASRRVRLCLAEKGVQFESVLVNLAALEHHTPEYLKKNPNGVIPLLVLEDGEPQPVVASRVVGATAASSRRYAYLGVGSRDGVRPGMPVRSPRGFIGRVLEVSPNTARVLLLTDTESIVPVRRAKDDIVAFAEGRGDGRINIRLINLGINPLKVGDVFVTSGAGGFFPAGRSRRDPVGENGRRRHCPHHQRSRSDRLRGRGTGVSAGNTRGRADARRPRSRPARAGERVMARTGLDRIQHAAARRDQYGSRINRDHMPLLLIAVPWGSILIAAVVPFFFLTSAIPLVPPLALLFMLAWRLVRPGVLQVWAGLPLGLWTDLFSGQPMGCSVLLFSLALLGIEMLESRFPWRDFLQDWVTATLAILVYLGFGVVFSGADVTAVTLAAVTPQALLSILAYPVVARFVAALDIVRLLRIRKVR